MTRRGVPPEVTWERVRPLLPDLGITRVGVLTGLDVLGLPVVSAYRPASRALIVTQGKGPTLMDARVGAVMEAVECWSAERLAVPLYTGSVRTLGDRLALVEPDTLPLVAGGRPLGPDEPAIWCEAQELGTGRAVWVPYTLVHTQYTPAGHLGGPRWVENSRGLAAGNDRPECLSHALCELIEGHANDGMWAMPDDLFTDRRVDLDTVDDPACRAALGACATAGVTVLCIDTTTEIGIASYSVMLLEADDHPWWVPAAARGMGCHPDRARALYRALSEAAQSRVTLIAGTREDQPVAVYQRGQRPESRQTLRELAKGAARPFHAAPSRAGPDRTALDDAATCMVALQRAGYQQALTVDCTVDARLPVLRVIVPGLRPEPRH